MRRSRPGIPSPAAFMLASSIATIVSLGTALATFVEANGDDFCRAKLLPLLSSVSGWHRASGAVTYAIDSWHYWTGRWFAMFLETAILGRISITSSYTSLVLATWVLITSGFLLLVRGVLGSNADRWLPAKASLILWALFWVGSPGAGDGLFWFTGSVENLLPVTLGIGVILLTVASVQATGARRWLWTGAASLGAVLVAGMHELHGLSLVMILSVGALVARTARTRDRFVWLCVAACGVAGTGLVLIAPGNHVRAGYFPSPDLLRAIRIVAHQVLAVLPGWVLSVPLLSASGLFLMHPTISNLKPEWIEAAFPGKRRFAVPAVAIVIIAAAFLGPAYALSNPAPGRTLSGAYMVFLIGWFFTLFVFTRDTAGLETFGAPSHPLRSAAMCFLALGLLTQGNAGTAWADLRYRAAAWHVARQARYDALQGSTRATSTVFVTRGPQAPELFFALDMLESTSGWRNECIAGYFEVPSVALLPVMPAAGATR